MFKLFRSILNKILFWIKVPALSAPPSPKEILTIPVNSDTVKFFAQLQSAGDEGSSIRTAKNKEAKDILRGIVNELYEDILSKIPEHIKNSLSKKKETIILCSIENIKSETLEEYFGYSSKKSFREYLNFDHKLFIHNLLIRKLKAVGIPAYAAYENDRDNRAIAVDVNSLQEVINTFMNNVKAQAVSNTPYRD